MSRSLVRVRDVRRDDASLLQVLWSELSPPSTDEPTPTDEVRVAVARVLDRADERIIVAEYDGEFAGAVHLRRRPISPVTTELAVHATHLRVRTEFRRRGVGRALLEAAVTFAEESQIGHVMAASSASARDVNRFMARLGLAQVTVVRVATTAALRGRLPRERRRLRRPSASGHRADRVLAVRRSMQRHAGNPG